MKHPVKFTFLGFYFNSLIDSGEFLDIKETNKKIEDRKLFEWLKNLYGDRLDISLYTDVELSKLENFFGSLSWNVDAERKMGVSKNGLCLLVAYCLEGAQCDPKDFDF